MTRLSCHKVPRRTPSDFAEKAPKQRGASFEWNKEDSRTRDDTERH
jgi:hypothetical protein